MSASLAANAKSRARIGRAGRWLAVTAALAVGACSMPDWADSMFEPDYGPAPQPVARAQAKPVPAAPEQVAAAEPAQREVEVVAAAPQQPRRVAAARTETAARDTSRDTASGARTETSRSTAALDAQPRAVAADSSAAKPAVVAPATPQPRAPRAAPVQATTAGSRDDSPTPMIAAMTRGKAPPSFSEEGSVVPRRTSLQSEPVSDPLQSADASDERSDVRTSEPAQAAMVRPTAAPRAPAAPERRQSRTAESDGAYTERLREAGIGADGNAAPATSNRVEPGQFPNSVSPVVQQTYRESLNAPRTYQEAISGTGGGRTLTGSGGGEPVVISGDGVYQPAAFGATSAASGGGPDAVIKFRHGSVSLSSSDMATIRRIAAEANRNNARIRIQGHASSRTGEMDVERHLLANLRVSAARADAVADALAGQGVPYDRIYVEAKGDNAPIYNEAMPSGEAGNRRAEIYLEY